MLQYLLGILLKEIIEAVTKMASDYLKLRAKRKEDAQSVKEALDEKDPKMRAKRIRNLIP
jgi:hypothetical protein